VRAGSLSIPTMYSALPATPFIRKKNSRMNVASGSLFFESGGLTSLSQVRDEHV
jgi:hypothetical protein